jgi:hypothetical protein
MIKKATTLLAAFSLFAGVAFGAGLTKKAAAIDNGDNGANKAVKSSVTAPMKTGALTWVSVDEAANVYGQASTGVEPLAYDPGTGAHTFIHRGRTTYPAGSGELWYNLSTDNGATWTRVAGGLMGGLPNTGRYPSGVISNPTGSSTLTDALFVWAAPNLNIGGSFAGAYYGVDPGLGLGAAVAFESTNPDSSLGSSAMMVASTSGPDVAWAFDDANGGLYLWSTNDFVTVNAGYPTGWTADDFAIYGAYAGMRYMNGKFYAAVYGIVGTDPQDDYNILYATSSDNAATWSSWNKMGTDWRTTVGAPSSAFLQGAPTGLNIEFVVDKNDKVHYFVVIGDTATNEAWIAELYEGPSGWVHQPVKTGLNLNTIQAYGGLDQTAWNLNASIDAAGEVIAVSWLDAATSAATDTMPDIWFSSRTLESGWATPANLTQSPDVPELVLHMAPTLIKVDATTYGVAFSRSYEVGLTPPALPGDTNPTEIFVAAYIFSPTAIGDETELPTSFSLEQNYPNPFNPSTRISYTIAQSGLVTLKVYDVLGKEVASLVDEMKEAGSYTADFNASNLANGAYFYKLQAGNFSQVKSMMLLK